MLLRGPSEKVFDQSICRTKEQKTRLLYLASTMPKSVMLSAAKMSTFRGGKAQESGGVI